MKLSNKILVGFFGFAFLYLTAVFAEVRLRGTPGEIDDTNSVAETADIPGVAHVLLQNVEKTINVVGSDQPRLEIRSLSGNLLPRLKYKLSGDTLTLWDLDSDDMNTVKISVFVPRTSFKGVTANKSSATVEGLEQALLTISQNAGRIWMSDNQIEKIHLEASGRSYLDISGTELDTLSARIDSSEVMISSPVRVLQGSMKDNAFLQMSDIDEIQLKKDRTSRLNVYQ